jgi:hypothetical protein
MEKRNYPAERKEAPQWECPMCNKVMSVRGKAGHLDKVHGRGKTLREHAPLPPAYHSLTQKKRSLSRSDVRNLVSNILYLIINATRNNNPIEIRKAMFQCEYIIRELEINFNCTLEVALKKFPVEKSTHQ